MKETFPGFNYLPNRVGGVIWNGTLQPTDESPSYAVRIIHNPRKVPKFFIERPSLVDNAPHRYPDGSLCLYWPKEWRWTTGASMAETLVEWAAFWLYYYEIWLVTGEWCGPVAPHSGDQPKEADE